MNDDVGYKKPPKKNRFRKGVSGNPNGRPKANGGDEHRSIALMKAIREFADQRVEVNEHGRRKKVSLRHLLIKKCAHNALSVGDAKSLDQLLKWVEKADRAAFEGRSGEPLRIIIEGGLPDDDQPKQIREIEVDEHWSVPR